MPRSTSAAALVALTLAVAHSAGAQAATRAAAAPRRPAHLAIATNPLAIPFGLFTLDVESATRTPGLTVGVGGTWLTDGLDRRWADARVMYFPGEVPLRGFALGLTAGVVSEQGDPSTNVCSSGGRCVPMRANDAAATLGVRMDYDWLVGARKRMLVGLGLGAKRVLRDVKDDSPLDQVYGDGRFVVGLVF